MKLKDSRLIFTALADPTRFRILSLLGERELCVCDLMRVLKEPQSKVSRHLSYLRRARLVEGRKDGLWMYYQITKPNVRIFQAILKALSQNTSDFEELKKDLGEFHKNKNSLVSCCS